MRVFLSTSGGQAAGLRLDRPPTEVDVSALSGPDARRVAELVAAVRADAPPPGRPRSAPDEVTYTVTVEDDDAPLVVERSDTTMSQPFADLLQWLQRHGSPSAL